MKHRRLIIHSETFDFSLMISSPFQVCNPALFYRRTSAQVLPKEKIAVSGHAGATTPVDAFKCKNISKPHRAMIIDLFESCSAVFDWCAK